jgi:glycosyltransferase involved in cell wall biosynthesis
MSWYYRAIPEQAAQQAVAILTISHASKEGILKYLDVAPDRVFVTHLAPDHIYRQAKGKTLLKSVRQKFQLPEHYILAIGSADPRKNIKTLLQAYSSLSEALQDQYHLALVCTHPSLTAALSELINSLRLAGKVHFLQQVTDAELALIYNAASLFVFPSRYEGFGLPPLEAMACGVPVVAANNSSIPEIVDDAALLVNVENPFALTEAIGRVLADRELQLSLTGKGLKQASGFSWEKCGRETLAVYRQALSK